jgi:glutamate N-acetyltransferase/amino-acid N-acetyltransferase
VLLYQNLEQLMMHLAELIVSDGEGASKFIRYVVQGAKDTETARRLARAMSSSTLVKTAMFGRDANWGRLIAACGNAGVGFDYTGADLYIGDRETIRQVLEKGKPTDIDRSQMKKLLRESHLQVKLVLEEGDGEALAMGTDMTTDYVLFNSVYTT